MLLVQIHIDYIFTYKKVFCKVVLSGGLLFLLELRRNIEYIYHSGIDKGRL